MVLKNIDRLPYPGNWSRPVGEHFSPRETIAIILHPFFQIPIDLVPALDGEEYQCFDLGDLPTVTWQQVLSLTKIESIGAIAHGLMNFVFRNIETPGEPKTLAALMELRAKGILLPDAHGISSSLIPVLKDQFDRSFGGHLSHPEDSKILSSPNCEAVVICLADQFFSYVAGPESFVSDLCKNSSLEISVVSPNTPLAWY